MRETDSNNRTVAAYEGGVKEYVSGTPQEVSGQFKDWIDTSLELLSEGANVLELGSAFGRDARYIESKGYLVQRTDATEGFVAMLQNEGYNAKLLNALTDDMGGSYDMIFANAVFLHFRPDELKNVLSKAHESLTNEGVLAFSVKRGDGDEWSSAKLGAPRYFCYWQATPLRELLSDAGFGEIQLHEALSDHRGGQEWLHVIARKV